MISIGDIQLTLPKAINLANIYKARPTYDYIYWNIIRAVLAENDIKDASLIDVGANIGDTIAHFRRFSNGPAIGVEPHDEYFELFKKNMAPVANVSAIKALVCPPDRIRDVSLTVGGGTGGTTLAPGAGTYKDATISTGQLLDMTVGHVLFKTDTDGFDQVILEDLITQMKQRNRKPAIISFEGPTEAQMRDNDYETFLAMTKKFCALGYRILMLNNIGAPIANVGDDYDRLEWHMSNLTRCLVAGIGSFPYFDFIAVAPSLTCETFTFNADQDQTIWTDIHPATA